MGRGKNDTNEIAGDRSWTNDALPLELRRSLLEEALNELRARKAAARADAGTRQRADRPGAPGRDAARCGDRRRDDGS